jgi:hypothetical protein
MTTKPPPWKAFAQLYHDSRERQRAVATPAMTAKPDWDASKAVWTKWINEQLHAIEDDLIAGWLKTIEAEDREGRGGFGDYINLAEHGCLEPLRELLPTLAKNPVQAEDLKYIAARFVNLPERFGKGDHWPKSDQVGAAVEDVKRIRDLWRQHFPNRRNKPPHVSATEIAAELHGIDEDKIINRMGRGKLRTKS